MHPPRSRNALQDVASRAIVDLGKSRILTVKAVEGARMARSAKEIADMLKRLQDYYGCVVRVREYRRSVRSVRPHIDTLAVTVMKFKRPTKRFTLPGTHVHFWDFVAYPRGSGR